MALNDRYATLPFDEAIAYLRSKINLDTDKWDDILDAEHDAAFVIAGAKGSLLADLRAAVDRAIANGQRPEEFQAEFERLSQGWAHTGSKAWRANIIYQTNLTQSYAAGRYAYQLDPEVVKLQPYLQAVHSRAERPRPAHIALDGKVFRANEIPIAFPSGYNCGCRYISLTQRHLNRQGLQVSDIKRGDLVDYVDERGNVRQAKIEPDKGFDRIPGQGDRAAILTAMMSKFPPQIQAQVKQEIAKINKAMAAKKKAAAKTKTTKKAPAKPKVAKPKSDFPSSLSEVREIKTLGGSTGAKLVEDQFGRKFVMKSGSSPDHLVEEMTADLAYQALGVKVPKFRQFQDANGNPVKLAQFIEGEPFANLSGKALDAARAELQKHFAVDALLGNWDVVGLAADNILVDKQGQVWRIDNGGSLRFRAQGAPKGKAWNGYPTELWTLRDRNVNQSTADAFAGLSYSQVVDQIEALAKQRKALNAVLPKALQADMAKRLDEMEHLAQIGKTLLRDLWEEAYVSEFSRHSLNLRASGLIDRLPVRLDWQPKSINTVLDENGKAFDLLRGSGSHLLELRDYIQASGGDYQLISDWMREQAQDSWNPWPQANKYFFVQQRQKPSSAYYWFNGFQDAESDYQQIVVDKKAHAITMTAWHAFTHEFLMRTQFGKRNGDLLVLYRTENRQVIRGLYNHSPGDKSVRMIRGAIESTSLYKKVVVTGNEATRQEVPLHRIFGTYFTEKKPGLGGSGFMGDHENEVIAMLDDLPFDYLTQAQQKQEGIL